MCSVLPTASTSILMSGTFAVPAPYVWCHIVQGLLLADHCPLHASITQHFCLGGDWELLSFLPIFPFAWNSSPVNSRWCCFSLFLRFCILSSLVIWSLRRSFSANCESTVSTSTEPVVSSCRLSQQTTHGESRRFHPFHCFSTPMCCPTATPVSI